MKCGRLYCRDDSTEENSCKFHFSEENADVGMVEPGTKCGEGMVSKRLALISLLEDLIPRGDH